MSHAVVREDRGEAATCGVTTAVGTVFFSLARDGSPHFMQRKIFSGCFYVMGLLECSRALESRAESILSSGGDESSAADLAGRAERMHKEGLAVFDRVIQWIKAGGTALGRPAFEGMWYAAWYALTWSKASRLAHTVCGDGGIRASDHNLIRLRHRRGALDSAQPAHDSVEHVPRDACGTCALLLAAVPLTAFGAENLRRGVGGVLSRYAGVVHHRNSQTY